MKAEAPLETRLPQLWAELAQAMRTLDALAARWLDRRSAALSLSALEEEIEATTRLTRRLERKIETAEKRLG